jgi:uncharacterized oxidoreductase
VLNGMLAIVIDPSRLDSGAGFAGESRQFLDWLRQSPVAPGFDKLRIAGEPERETRARREREGIPVDPTTWAEILAAGTKLKVKELTLQQLAEGR